MALTRATSTRRAFIAGVVGFGAAAIGLTLPASCAAPLTRAEPPRVRRIGWLTVREPGVVTLHRFLPQLGWVEGRDFVVEFRNAGGVFERLPALATELVELPVDILISSTVAPTRAAQQATRTTPIVFIGMGPDPVAEGFVASLARPGGNITGVANGLHLITAKRLEFLKAAAPGISRVGVLINTEAPDHTSALRVLRETAQLLQLDLLDPVRLNSLEELDSALETLASQRPDALIDLHAWGFYGAAVGSGITTAPFAKLLDFTAAHRLPHVSDHEAVRAGALMGLGASLDGLGRSLALLVDRILRGADPAELPVVTSSDWVFMVNLGMAHRLGLAIPEGVLRQATEVVQ